MESAVLPTLVISRINADDAFSYSLIGWCAKLKHFQSALYVFLFSPESASSQPSEWQSDHFFANGLISRSRHRWIHHGDQCTLTTLISLTVSKLKVRLQSCFHIKKTTRTESSLQWRPWGLLSDIVESAVRDSVDVVRRDWIALLQSKWSSWPKWYLSPVAVPTYKSYTLSSRDWFLAKCKA